MDDRDFTAWYSEYGIEVKCRHCGSIVARDARIRSEVDPELVAQRARESGHLCSQLEAMENQRRIIELLEAVR